MNRALIVAFVSLGLAACGTVTPHVVGSSQASFEGNQQTSGVLEFLPEGLHVTAGARARYNELIKLYGRDYRPALTFNYGVREWTEGTFVLTREAAIKFDEMSKWRRAGLQPLNP